MLTSDFCDTIGYGSDESSGDRESDVSSVYDLADLPYCSPNEDSETDDNIVQMDFSVFSMENNDESRLLDVPEGNIPSSDEVLGQEHEWCKCNNCSTSTVQCAAKEAVCCQDKSELSEFVQFGQCVTDQSFFQAQLLSEDGLQYNRLIIASVIKDASSRNKFLSKPFDNTLKRHICYRNFVAFTNGGQPMGRNNRVVLPRCVVNKIRETYPDPQGNYTGYSDPAETDRNDC